MLQKEIKVCNETGIHARPAGVIAHRASQYKSDITIIHKGEEYDAKSIISVMAMAADMGDDLLVKADGQDEQEALDGIVNLILNEIK